MKVLSLFDGISCGRVALERAGFHVERYVAFEIDKYAISISKKNYPDIEHRGSVVGADFKEFKGFDLVLGGFPCTDLSIAGRRAGLQGEYSSLFWELERAIREVKPTYFLVENNYGMPKEAEEDITFTLEVEPIFIDSALVSAQMRKRLYWTNIRNVTAPSDRGLALKDILQKEVEEKYYVRNLHNPRAKRTIRDPKGKALCLGSSVCKGSGSNTMSLLPVKLGDIANGGQAGRVYSEFGKRVCLKAAGGGQGAKTGLYAQKSYPENPNSFEVKGGYMYYKETSRKLNVSDGVYTVRKLTPLECERLQTLPDNYTEGVSDTQRYKMLGNGWTVDVIAHILNHIEVC